MPDSILDNLFGKKPLKKAVEDPDANKAAPVVQDNTYLKKKVSDYMAKKSPVLAPVTKGIPPVVPPAKKPSKVQEALEE